MEKLILGRSANKDYLAFQEMRNKYKKDGERVLFVSSIKTVQQHDAEIRKPLEDEIEKLKSAQTKLAIEKLEEVLNWVDKESDGSQMYPVLILIERLNKTIAELKGGKNDK